MKKRGQFYLIAAVLIVGLLIGIVGVATYVVKYKKDYRALDVQDELKLESEYIINYGVYTSTDFNDLLSTFAEEYADYIGEEYDVLFVFGDEDFEATLILNYVSLFQVSQTASLTIGTGNSPSFNVISQSFKDGEINFNPISGDKIEMTIGETNYEFELREGQKFYFVVKQPREDE
ncbi:MAG: hypothetical protein U9Q06_03160 [Nanoarchaeota archaeon]|nr:hypothetical protein [Nanoarchaeota archaeon]